jgi:hypothetical protein
MSRGHGSTQRFILEQLQSLIGGDVEWIRARSLASIRTGSDRPTRAQLETIRNAARRLAAAGLVDLAYYEGGPTDAHGNPAGKLHKQPGKGELALRAAKSG